jgi:hypothetical protein
MSNDAFGSAKRVNLKGNLAQVPSVGHLQQWGRTGMQMENDNENARGNVRESAKKYRDYAAECLRLAQRASEKDRKVLIEIAGAWIACAEEAERKAAPSNNRT